MGIIDQIARGLPDAGGGAVRGIVQGEQLAQGRQRLGLRAALVGSTINERLRQVQTQEEAAQVIDQLARSMLPALAGKDGPEYDLVRGRLESGNPILQNDGLTQLQQLLGPQQFMGAMVQAVNPETGEVELFNRTAGGQLSATGYKAPPKTGQSINVNTQPFGEDAATAQKNKIRDAQVTAFASEDLPKLDAIPQTRQKINQFRALMKQFKTGTFGDIKLRAGAFLEGLGVDPAALGITDDVAAGQALRSLSVGFAMAFVQQTKGAISNKEMELFVRSVPGIELTEGANTILLDIMDNAMAFEQRYLRAKRNWFASGKDPSKWDEQSDRMIDNWVPVTPEQREALDLPPAGFTILPPG